MSTVLAELLKIRRSLAWVVAVLLPLAMAVVGSSTTLAAGDGLEDGWRTLWMQSMVFYGIFPLGVGISILAALVWRPEHRDGNRNALMTTPRPFLTIFAGKTAVIALLAVIMQAIMVVSVIVLGTVVFGLPGMLGGEHVVSSALIAAASVPVAALQSAAALLMRSFAAPVALGFVLSAVSGALVSAGIAPVMALSPYAVLSFATQTGTGVFSDAGAAAGTGPGLWATLAVLGFAAVHLTAALGIGTRLLGRTGERS